MSANWLTMQSPWRKDSLASAERDVPAFRD
jgi:hypothetical protein